jgi:hypothetical protein
MCSEGERVAGQHAVGGHLRRQAHYFLNLLIGCEQRYRQGGARPVKGEAEAKSDAELDRAASSRVSPLGNEDLLALPQSPHA